MYIMKITIIGLPAGIYHALSEECRYPEELLRSERSRVKATQGRSARGLPIRIMSIKRKKASA